MNFIRVIDPTPESTIMFLKQMDQPGMAILVRELKEENRCLERELKYQTERRTFAEKAYLQEVDRSWFAKIFS